MLFNENNYIELQPNSENIQSVSKVHVLPNIMVTNFSKVTIFLIKSGCCVVESQNGPIRHGNKWGSRVRLGGEMGFFDYAPVFIWNGREWLLNTWGTFIFDEIEMNPKPREHECN